jgi:membrane protein implicated in regulation of membrane protease activity
MRPLSERRRRRLERELRALHAMEGHLRTRDLVWSMLAIPLLVLLCALIAFKLSWFGAAVPGALAGAAAAGFGIWWIGRRWFTLAALIVMALLCILFEDVPSLDWPSTEDQGKKRGPNDKRRLKLERAIARREALLRRPLG